MSASTLAVTRKELTGRQPALKMLAVFADPVFAGDDERNKPTTAKRQPQSGNDATSKNQSLAYLTNQNLPLKNWDATFPLLLKQNAIKSI